MESANPFILSAKMACMWPPNQALQPIATPPLRYGSASAEFGRWAALERFAMRRLSGILRK